MTGHPGLELRQAVIHEYTEKREEFMILCSNDCV